MIFDNAGISDFTDVASLLVSSGVTPADAQRYGCSVTKAHSADNDKICLFELYGQGGLSKAAKRYRGLNV